MLAERGVVLVCGGLGGVMEAACRGAKEAGGTTVGILPGADRDEANSFVDVAIPTGMGEARNALVVRAADAVVAIGGDYGTLSEVALALKAGKPVVGIGTWEIDGVVPAPDAAAAVEAVLTTQHLDSRTLGRPVRHAVSRRAARVRRPRSGPLPRARAQGRPGRRPRPRRGLGERVFGSTSPRSPTASTWATSPRRSSRRSGWRPRRGARGAPGGS